ncbi:hypothetical protein [Pseudomonas bohemica]|uniref:hypothetical protein n=1 Tax=Pseudomonas bohemica TaxID=2044872 RepID=UPI000DA5F269|nr:hypothetical protein [Pseudomonas bohemica]
MQVTPLMTRPTWPTTPYGPLEKNRTMSENIQNAETAAAENDINVGKPWLKNHPGLEGVKDMKDYLSTLHTIACLRLKTMKWSYDSFENDLAKDAPELAEKDFGFSIDSRGRINILDPGRNLTSDDQCSLRRRLEQCHSLERSARGFVELVNFIAKYDKSEFSPFQHLKPGSLAESFDYRAILRSEDMSEAWRSQIHQHAQIQAQAQAQAQAQETTQVETQNPSISEIV